MSGLPLYKRALKQPHHAKRVLEIAKDEGFGRTYKRVRGMLVGGRADRLLGRGRRRRRR